MAKMFYTKEEVLEKLGRSDEQLKKLIQEGKLREFRDGNKLMFKVDEVDNLATDDLDLTPIDSLGDDELNLDGSGGGLGLPGSSGSDLGLASMETGSQIGLAPSETGPFKPSAVVPSKKNVPVSSLDSGSQIGLAPGDSADRVSLDDHPQAKDKDDTVVTQHGEEAAASESGSAVMSDPLGGDMPEPDFGDEISLDGGGASASGSGLLDLSREADDTSLGAELLDEIYPEPSEELGEPKPSKLEVATSTSTGTETSSVSATADTPVLTAAAAGGPSEMVRTIHVMYDNTSGVFGAVMIVPFLMLIYLALVSLAGMMNLQPELLKAINSKIWYVAGGAGLVTLLVLVSGLVMSNRSSQPAQPKAKKPAAKPAAKAAKPAKPVVKEKPKKGK